MKKWVMQVVPGSMVLMLGLATANPAFAAGKAADSNVLSAYVGQCITVGLEGGEQLLELVGTLVSVGSQFLELDLPVFQGPDPTGETVQLYAALNKVAFVVPDNPFTDACDGAAQPAAGKDGSAISGLGLIR